MSDKSKPAFPATIDSGFVVMDDDGKPEHMSAHVTGMTLREHYAGLAMQGAIANDELLTRIDDGDRSAMQFCVAWADALIAELQREAGDE